MRSLYSNKGEHPLVQRFHNLVALSPDEVTALRVLANKPLRTVGARRDIIREGEPPRGVQLIISGWACAYRMLADGRRQNLAFYLPGDLTDIHHDVLDEMDHSITALSEVQYVELACNELDQLGSTYPGLLRALRLQSMVAKAVQREWMVGIGQRSAFERLSHLFCELFLRLEAVGLTDNMVCDMLATQPDLAEATGLTPIHVNRMLRDMREAGLVELKNRRLSIRNFAALQASGLFLPKYLHFKSPRLVSDAKDFDVIQATTNGA